MQGIHLACITGLNGAGKSSLLDAITWGLFGQSRSKSDDDIVNRLAVVKGEAAEVRFTFILEGVTYRVVRRKEAGKTMNLEFQVATDEGKWKSLSEGRLRETQGVIESVLNMNFDTFVNSSFLLQGKADEFTTKTPNKRKEILADLLGVNEWDLYKEAAAEKRKESENRLILIDGRLMDIDSELSEQPEREAALASAMEKLQSVNEQLRLQEQLLDEVRRTDTARKQQEQILKNLADSIQRTQRSLDEVLKTKTKRQQERDTYQMLLDRAEIIMANYGAWQEADALANQWQEKADQYNAIQQKIRPYELEIERERSRLAQRKTELENQRRRVEAMQDESTTLNEELKLHEEQLNPLEERLDDLIKVEQQWQQEKDSLQKLKSKREALALEAGQLRSRSSRVDELRQERSAVNRNLAGARETVTELTSELEALSKRHERLMSALAEIDNVKAEQRRLHEQMKILKQRIGQLHADMGEKCPLCGQPLSEEHRQTVLSELEAQGKADGDRYRQNEIAIKALEDEIADLQDKVQHKDRLQRDERTQQKRVATAEARLAEIERSIDEWETGEANRLREIKTELADESELVTHQKTVSDLAKIVEEKATLEKNRQTLQLKTVELKTRLAQIERAISEWRGIEPAEGLEAELVRVRKQLESGEFALESQAVLKELEAKADVLLYDPVAHQMASKNRSELAEAQLEYQDLQRAQAALKPLNDNLADLDLQIANQQQSLADLNRQLEAAAAQLESLAKGGMELAMVENAVNQLRDEAIAANRHVAIAQQNVSVLKDLDKERKKGSADRAEVTQLIRRYKLLEKAFGREGVQALLIERALPEIEDDANELLQRLTGGQMQVTFETQRRLKTSDRLAETLDIHIADSAGERPYENYSGGEQFRVNFAIRLALSKILTRRAGARLQTLVIDEGFGSQDPAGRQRLIEAINTIQNDFERILVITHIDEMRDAFPVRIEVEKGPAGSIISVN